MTTDQRLLPSQKNTIFGAIKKFGLDPARFEWDEEELALTSYGARTISKLICNSSPYFYTFDVVQQRKFRCERCPGSRATTDIEEFPNWDRVGGDFAIWLAKVKRELGEPDLWGEVQKYVPSFPILSKQISREEVFTEEDSRRTLAALKEVEGRIIEELGFQGEELRYIRDSLSYLQSRAKEGYYKIDWANLLLSTLINVGLALSLDSDKLTQIYSFFKEALSPVMRLFGG
jgi:hypothetical protein